MSEKLTIQTPVNTINGSCLNQDAFFQPKLSINQPNDVYEQEADAMAENVMRMTDNSIQHNTFFKPAVTTLQRKCAHCEEEEKRAQRKELSNNDAEPESSATENYISKLSGGNQLNEEDRTFFESRMGYDFSDVKIHADTEAAKSAQSINARAYTTGNNIVFGSGQYQPGTQVGKQLLAHELTHTIQQKSITAQKIQRAPAGVSFDPPTVIRKNPLDKMNSGETPGKTKLTINGAEVDDSSFANEMDDIKKKITPPVVQQAGTGSTKNCSFDPAFNLKVSTNIYIITAPGAKGWSGSIDMSKVPGAPVSCAGKGLIPANMTAKPTSQSYATLVEQSEMEHVKELETLHHRHLEPYYNFIKTLGPATGTSEDDCSKNLLAKVDKRDDQAALGFGLADVAETRKFDAPASTHHGTTTVTKIGAGCSSAELEARQDHPQIAGNQPGNVAIAAPVQTIIDNSKLKVSGNDLTDTVGFTRTFSSTANAVLALRILRAYHVTSINTIGKFEFLLDGTSAPTGAGPKANEINIDPALYQVTISFPNPDEWMISQVNQDRVLPIIKFGNARDTAYSAIEQMRKFSFNIFGWVGADQDNPEFSYFKA